MMQYTILEEQEWHQRSRDLKKRVNDRLKSYFANRSKSKKHPVIDFLFEYYFFRFSELKLWSPGAGVILAGETAFQYLENPIYQKQNDGVNVDCLQIPDKRRDSLSWIVELLQATNSRAPFFGCMGLHEWAMVYNVTKPRHNIPLRLTMPQIKEFVESNRIHCSHYDAYRFFSKDAVDFNEVRPTKQTRHAFEQPGCLHTNMDLYKWAHKFYPWVSSEVIVDAFELAWEIREVDMRASPYDLSEFGYEPILLETTAGRQEYIQLQKDFFTKSQPLRERLICEYQTILQFLAVT